MAASRSPDLDVATWQGATCGNSGGFARAALPYGGETRESGDCRRLVSVDDFSAAVPESCSLSLAERPLRVAEFGRMFAESALRTSRAATTRLDVVIRSAAVPTARDLAARESQCCSFFTFEFEPMDPDVVMRISVPEPYVDVLDGIEAQVRETGDG